MNENKIYYTVQIVKQGKTEKTPFSWNPERLERWLQYYNRKGEYEDVPKKFSWAIESPETPYSFVFTRTDTGKKLETGEFESSYTVLVVKDGERERSLFTWSPWSLRLWLYMQGCYNGKTKRFWWMFGPVFSMIFFIGLLRFAFWRNESDTQSLGGFSILVLGNLAYLVLVHPIVVTRVGQPRTWWNLRKSYKRHRARWRKECGFSPWQYPPTIDMLLTVSSKWSIENSERGW